jgi:hypothetical protein
MEQKEKITSLQKLIDWIDNSNICHVTEQGDDYFLVEASNNADVHVWVKENDNINDIISDTARQLEEFDADERFMELWSKEFAEHNHFSPSQFIKMLQEDEKTFRDVAYRLRDFVFFNDKFYT